MDDQSRRHREKAAECAAPPLLAHVTEATQIAKYHTPGGTGFAAEDANHARDLLLGRRPKLVGVSNEKNGADRIVGRLSLQSKYYCSPAETVAAAFDPESSIYRYPGHALEVPRDQYDACVDLMRRRIQSGKVPGFENPAEAESLVQRGAITYRQARNIARPGNIESLKFDVVTQAVVSSSGMGLSFVVMYASRVWSGERHNIAIRHAARDASLVGGQTLATGVISAQILRTKIAAASSAAIRHVLKAGYKTNVGKRLVKGVATGSLGKAVRGAAATNHVAKVLRTNAVTAAVAAAVMTTPDFYRVAFARSISWRQFTKNASINASQTAAGAVGWLGGAAGGAALGSFIPGVGTAVGGIVGGFVGAASAGVAGSKLARSVADRVAKDDEELLREIVSIEMQMIACEHLLTLPEIERLGQAINDTTTTDWIRNAFRQSSGGNDREALGGLLREDFEPIILALVEERPKISLPYESPD
jgi:hypothetical protein